MRFSSAHFILALSFALTACAQKKPQSDPPPIDTTPIPVPPPVSMEGVPVSAFLDAAVPNTPFEQARMYEENGQLWLARLVLEPKAMGEEGTKPEMELLAQICNEQGDDACIAKVSQRAGKKFKFPDAGAPRKPVPSAVPEHREPNTDAAKARDLFLQRNVKEARAILEPKVVDGKSTPDEVRLLKTICKDQGDRMCVALCDAKLK